MLKEILFAAKLLLVENLHAGVSVKRDFNCSGMAIGGNFDLTGMRIYTGSLNMGNTKNVKA